MNTQTLLGSDLPNEASTLAELSAMPTVLSPSGDPIRHILLGTPGGVRQTIHLLHTLRYVENALWSPLLPITDNKLIITPNQGEVMSLLIKSVS